MRIDVRRDVIEVQVGPTFSPADAARIDEAVAAVGSLSRLTIDFGAVRECDDAALVLLATRLRRRAEGRISLSGLTHHQWRLLTYLGLEPEQGEASAAEEP